MDELIQPSSHGRRMPGDVILHEVYVEISIRLMHFYQVGRIINPKNIPNNHKKKRNFTTSETCVIMAQPFLLWRPGALGAITAQTLNENHPGIISVYACASAVNRLKPKRTKTKYIVQPALQILEFCRILFTTTTTTATTSTTTATTTTSTTTTNNNNGYYSCWWCCYQ